MKITQQHHATNQMSLVCANALLDGRLMLESLDKMIPAGCAYARHMDDWVILTRTRRQELEMKVRQVVKNMHDIVHGLKLRLALKKTFIGRISKGFDFLGCRSNGFGTLGLTGLAQQTINSHKQKLLLRYEQNASDQRVEKYVSNWKRWTVSGLAGVLRVFSKGYTEDCPLILNRPRPLTN